MNSNVAINMIENISASKRQWQYSDLFVSSFVQASALFLAKWEVESASAEVVEFMSYFRGEWIDENPNWFEGYAHPSTAPSTNNGNEAINAVIKKEDSFRELLDLPTFLATRVVGRERSSANKQQVLCDKDSDRSTNVENRISVQANSWDISTRQVSELLFCQVCWQQPSFEWTGHRALLGAYGEREFQQFQPIRFNSVGLLARHNAGLGVWVKLVPRNLHVYTLLEELHLQTCSRGWSTSEIRNAMHADGRQDDTTGPEAFERKTWLSLTSTSATTIYICIYSSQRRWWSGWRLRGRCSKFNKQPTTTTTTTTTTDRELELWRRYDLWTNWASVHSTQSGHNRAGHWRSSGVERSSSRWACWSASNTGSGDSTQAGKACCSEAVGYSARCICHQPYGGRKSFETNYSSSFDDRVEDELEIVCLLFARYC